MCSTLHPACTRGSQRCGPLLHTHSLRPSHSLRYGGTWQVRAHSLTMMSHAKADGTRAAILYALLRKLRRTGSMPRKK